VGGALRVGIVGVGKISEQYLAQLPMLPNLELVAVADLDIDRAVSVGRVHGVRASSVDDLIGADDVDVVLNLTIPAAHVEVGMRALTAGKHVFAEKPLGLGTAEARPLLELADSVGLRVGSAPDTVLGTGVQTARRLLDDGAIGEPVAAAAHWTAAGHEAWHPAPEFYYQPGGGPLFDMGPYYLTTLVSLFGPVAFVQGASLRSERERVVATGPRAGSAIPVDVETHVTAILTHRSGAISTVTLSFEVWASRTPKIEVYGTSGTISVADPNQFDDVTEVWRDAETGWTAPGALAGYANAGRGVGLSDMARALETGQPHRASGELAFHVLEIMESILTAARDRTVFELTTAPPRPTPVAPASTPWTW
jgi:predicted dehydrogenase